MVREEITGSAALSIEIRAGQAPVCRATFPDGRTVVRTVGLSHFLTLLDESAVVQTLETKPAQRSVSLPPVPPRTLLVSYRERAGLSDQGIVTAWSEAEARPVVVDEGDERTAHVFAFPPICYTIVYDLDARRISGMSVGVASPEARFIGPDTPLYRYPLSNVYGNGSVCWPTMRREEWPLDEAERMALDAFIAVPNNADAYGLGQSHNAPWNGYREFLENVEKGGGLREEWLIPLQKTPEEMHDERRDGK